MPPRTPLAGSAGAAIGTTGPVTPAGLQIGPPVTHGRLLGHSLGGQLFFDLWAMELPNGGTTYVPLQTSSEASVEPWAARGWA